VDSGLQEAYELYEHETMAHVGKRMQKVLEVMK
jgi:hypothetical protein